MPANGYTYSFLDVKAAIAGPGAAFNIGSDAGVSEEGISVEPNNDIGSMLVGADGSVMHSLYGDKSGKVTVRLLKDSPVNNQLSIAYDIQTSSGAQYGQNTITIVNTASGDSITCQQCGFARAPNVTYAKDGGIMEWTFNAGVIDRLLGAGV